MSQPAVPPAAPAAAGDDDLRIVLFGLPAAGKTSLLGALGQSARTQEHLLGGKLEDESQGLGELGRQVYDETPRRTPEEVVPYPVRYQPFTPDSKLGKAVDAVLLDCDGRVANDLLVRRQGLDEDSPEGTLAHEVVDGDTLILVIDASASESQMAADFSEFGRFLQMMQQLRGERTAVAGLPVFLVLTKCDLLVKPGDSASAWMERIEQRKREVDERFRAFIAGQPEAKADPQARSDPSPFGRIDLHVWATAIKRPPLLQSLAKPREPYGVAELFRQCLTAAAGYRRRCERSSRRLVGLVAGAVVLVGGMLGLAGTLFVVNASTRASILRDRVEDIRAYDRGTPAERLKVSLEQLRLRQRQLEGIHDDALFEKLPADLRTFVEERLGELKEYVPYFEKILSQRSLASEQTEDGLDQTIERLREELAPPHAEWADTLAGQIHKNRLESAEALRKAVRMVRNWYLDASDQARRLWRFEDHRPAEGGAIDWPDWTTQTENLLDPKRRPPFRESDPIPGAPGGVLTYATALRMDRVVEARSAWDTDRAELNRLLNLASALGLAAPTKTRPAVLVFARDFSLREAAKRMAELKSAYPDYEKTLVRDRLPEAIVPRIRQAARRQYEILLEPARAEVLRQLRLAGKGSAETTARWEVVREWLRQPDELASWRELARVLVRIENPLAPEPVQALAAFLGQKQFTLEVSTIRVEIAEVSGVRPRAEARLVVLQAAGMRPPALAFDTSGEPARDTARRVRVWTYRASDRQRLTYRPGDKLWAELPVQGGKERLVWSQSRSASYQFERLRTSPRLQSQTAPSPDEGRVQADVRLVLQPEDGVPAIPDLMPQVRLDE